MCLSIILWCIDPLLGRDLETDEYSLCYAIGGQTNKQTNVSIQRLGEHVPAERILSRVGVTIRQGLD
jgi:hypothetical protein